jgi:hypothetical protein
MAQDPYSDEEQALFEREVERKLRSELPSVREEEIKAAAHRAAQRELELHRDELRDQLDSEVEETAAESPRELREEANRETPSKLLIGVILLILLLLLLAATNRLPGFGQRQGDAGNASANSAGDALAGILSGPTATPVGGVQGASTDVNSQIGRGLPNAGEVDGLNSVVAPATLPVDPLFEQFYNERGGVPIFGLPLSPVVTVNGRRVQWFERARLEYWPEYENTPYRIQSGLVGVEYTDSREFQKQTYFPCQPDLCFFPETSHAVGGAFLNFWNANGGLEIFGYPISEQIVEVEPGTNRYRVVQYFQRARMELNNDPDLVAAGQQVQLGLLGRALYLNEARSTIVADPAPTPVPLP